jgi:hypothetical protein
MHYLPYRLILLQFSRKRNFLPTYRKRIDLLAFTARSLLCLKKMSIVTGPVFTTSPRLTSAMSQDAIDLKRGSRGRTTTTPIFAMFIKSYLRTQPKSKHETATSFHRSVGRGRLERKTVWKAIHGRSSLRWWMRNERNVEVNSEGDRRWKTS